jgi:ATP-dependent exoDNAse (exonuclease V) beta subunit
MTINLIEHDKTERQKALNPHQSFIVQAPAGSGKTELLIQRFLTLLNHVDAPEEILAITFTKKAASEMRARVVKALKYASTEPEPESEHAQKTWRLAKSVLKRDQDLEWHLIANPNQLRIQTIDSLCSYLTKQLPLLSHFGSQPDITDNPTELYHQAVQTILMQVEANDELASYISQLLMHLDNDFNKLHDLLVNLLAKRDQWLPYIHLDTSDEKINRELLQHISLVITDHLQTLRAIFPENVTPELISIARFAAENVAPDSPLYVFREINTLPSAKPDYLNAWLGLAKLLLTSTYTWRKRVDEKIGFPALTSLKNPDEKALHQSYRQRLNTIIESISADQALHKALVDIFFLPAAFYQDSQWQILQALLHVLKMVAAQLRVSFQQHGVIDFIENSQAALVALGTDDNPTDLTLALDYRIRHILVDEFQDTAFTQYQLLEKLLQGWEKDDGRTLFVVGDPMQSIYRFREAEVGLFIRMRDKGIANITLTPLRLSLNFRATSHLIEWNNQQFSAIFPSFTDIAVGAVNYSASVTPEFKEDMHSFVGVHATSSNNDNEQASNLVQLLQTTMQAYPNDSIAILVRSRTHLKNIIPLLKKTNIPFRAVNIDPLASRQCIQDLLSLTCALLHPADRIAWLSLLRAPWCGLSLADLLLVAGENPYVTLFEQLQKADLVQRLSVDGQARINRILPILKNKITDRERENLRLWIESTWLLLGGPACLNDASDREDVEVFFNLLTSFAEVHHINIDQLKEKIKHLYAAPQKEETRLQIMTIHTAKGLEFDTVILPRLERKMPHDDKPLLAWMERPLTQGKQDKVALLLAPIHATGGQTDRIYDYINRQQKLKSDYETDRLLYVAATRAKKRLHLFFNMSLKDNGDAKIESGSFLEKLWPLLKQKTYAKKQSSPDTLSVSGNLTDLSKKPMFSRLSVDWINPYRLEASSALVLHKRNEGFKPTDNQAKFIGIVVHKLIQQLSLLGINWWQALSTGNQMLLIEQHLQQLSLPLNLMLASKNIIKQTMQNILLDERGRWILHTHTEAKSEYPLTALIDGKLENLVIDRTFIDENNIRWIIDYKTAAPTTDNINQFLADEKEKYHKQMQKYANALRLIDEREIRLGLYFPAIPAWVV